MVRTISHPGRLSVRFLLFVLISAPQAIFGQATSELLSNVATQYDDLYLSAAYPDGFGIPLKAQAFLNVTYPTGPVTLAKSYSVDEVKTLPTFTVTPVNASAFKAPNVFTLMFADANALGNPDKDGNYRHFLENGVTFGDAGNNAAMTLNAGSGTVVTSYAGPGPLPQTGVHRYAWLLFVQPSTFHAPANLSTAGVAPSHWHVNSYVSSTGLGDLVAASFFTVQNGNATFHHNGTVSHISTPTNVASQTQSNTTTPNSPARAGATSGNDGAILTDCVGIVKSVVMGLGVAFSGYVLVQ